MDEMLMVGRRQDSTLAPSVSGHLHYEGNGKDGERHIRAIKRERESRDEID
jgi:hypothetical protein